MIFGGLIGEEQALVTLEGKPISPLYLSFLKGSCWLALDEIT